METRCAGRANRKSAADSRNHGEGFFPSSGVQAMRQRGNSCDFRRAGIHLHWTSIWLTVHGLSFASSSVFLPSSPRQRQTARCPLGAAGAGPAGHKAAPHASSPATQPVLPGAPANLPADTQTHAKGPTEPLWPVPNVSRAAAVRARLTRGELTGTRCRDAEGKVLP